MKYEMIFGDEALFDGCDENAVAVIDDMTGTRKSSKIEFFPDDALNFETVDVDSRRIKLAMRRIIKEPVWTEKDRRSNKLPPVGMIVKWVNESYTAGTEGAAYPEVWTDVLILAETDNATLSEKGVVFKWHTKHGVLTSFTTRAMDFSPIETPAEKAQREENEFVKSEMKGTTLSIEWACIYERGVRAAYRKLKGGE